ncbi:MAG: hypothetical protein ACQCN6_05455 [Candidatus Bathyarchaeia archaeon]
MTKHLHDELKCQISVEDAKVMPQLIDNSSLVIGAPVIKVKNKRMVKAKVTPKKSKLDRATSNLYDLEDSHGPEKTLNIDLGLYQMEDF